MEHLVGAVRQALSQHNYYAALALALTLPDICASIESDDGLTTRAQYAAWFDRYLLADYTMPVGVARTPHVFMHGGDCYALRCAFLHQGVGDATGQRHEDRRRFRWLAGLAAPRRTLSGA